MEEEFLDDTEHYLSHIRWLARRDAIGICVRELKLRWRYNLRANLAMFITGVCCFFLSIVGAVILTSPTMFALTPALASAIGFSLVFSGGLSGIFCMIHNAFAKLPSPPVGQGSQSSPHEDFSLKSVHQFSGGNVYVLTNSPLQESSSMTKIDKHSSEKNVDPDGSLTEEPIDYGSLPSSLIGPKLSFS